MWKLVSSKKKPKTASHSFIKVFLTLIIAAALVFVILLNVFTHVFSVVRYYGDSMEPSLKDRQMLIVMQTDKVKSGDIAAFYYNNKVLVRRIIAESGTSIELDSAGNVYIDSSRLEEPYVDTFSVGQCNINFPFIVPYNEYFVMGDNRLISMDSRLKEIGTVPKDRILGKVIFSFG